MINLPKSTLILATLMLLVINHFVKAQNDKSKKYKSKSDFEVISCTDLKLKNSLAKIYKDDPEIKKADSFFVKMGLHPLSNKENIIGKEFHFKSKSNEITDGVFKIYAQIYKRPNSPRNYVLMNISFEGIKKPFQAAACLEYFPKAQVFVLLYNEGKMYIEGKDYFNYGFVRRKPANRKGEVLMEIADYLHNKDKKNKPATPSKKDVSGDDKSTVKKGCEFYWNLAGDVIVEKAKYNEGIISVISRIATVKATGAQATAGFFIYSLYTCCQ
jgi:hypothetical protein